MARPPKVAPNSEASSTSLPPAGDRKKQNQPKTQLSKSKSDLRRRGRIIAKSLLEGKSTTQACKDAGYSDSYAKTRQDDIIGNPKIQQSFHQILDAAGLTDDHIAARIKELSAAKETKFFSDKGIVIETREVEALGIQSDMVQFAARLKGHLVDKLEHSGGIDLTERLKAARERLAKVGRNG